jgi:hypothetical protein
MYARLGFAVASHADPDLLLVDEVLAVGDGVFLSRCRDRINLLRQRGTAIVLVSHQLQLVNSLSEFTVVLDGGQMAFYGETPRAIGHYTEILARSTTKTIRKDADTYACLVEDVKINGTSRSVRLRFGEPARLEVSFSSRSQIVDGILNLAIWNRNGETIASYTTRVAERRLLSIPVGISTITCDLPHFRLAPGSYTIGVTISDCNVLSNYLCDQLTTLTVEQDRSIDSRYGWWISACCPSIHNQSGVLGERVSNSSYP